jgi:ribulose-phosphate 3-epimerase
MLSRPEQYIERFVKAGADTVLVHIEADCDVPAALDAIRRLGVRVGITLNPETHDETIHGVLAKVDEVLCMTVRPGYGGQSFMDEVLPKVRRIRDQASKLGLSELDIMVDGGINNETVLRCAAHGANAFVAGTSLFGAPDMPFEIARFRETARQSLVL